MTILENHFMQTFQWLVLWVSSQYNRIWNNAIPFGLTNWHPSTTTTNCDTNSHYRRPIKQTSSNWSSKWWHFRNHWIRNPREDLVLLKTQTSNISSLETSTRQWPDCGCRAWSSCLRIFIFCTRSRLYFGSGESASPGQPLLSVVMLTVVCRGGLVTGGDVVLGTSELLTTNPCELSRLQPVTKFSV